MNRESIFALSPSARQSNWLLAEKSGVGVSEVHWRSKIGLVER